MRAKKFSKFTILLVEWEDITSDAKWHNTQELDGAKTTTVKSVRFFIDNKKHRLKISRSITEDGDADYTVIPWGCVRKVGEVK
jgi:hypothetical protein